MNNLFYQIHILCILFKIYIQYLVLYNLPNLFMRHYRCVNFDKKYIQYLVFIIYQIHCRV